MVKNGRNVHTKISQYDTAGENAIQQKWIKWTKSPKSLDGD